MLRAVVVGLGGWGQRLARSVHQKSDKIRIVKAVTRTPAKVEEFSRTSGIEVVTDFAGVLADPAVDAVILATPHSQHVAQVKEAAAAGKHIFVEKPLALERTGAESAFDACERADVVLAVGQNRRFLPAVHHLRALIAAGEFGQLLHAEANFSGTERGAPRRQRLAREPRGESVGRHDRQGPPHV